jgi:hypothetical protein
VAVVALLAGTGAMAEQARADRSVSVDAPGFEGSRTVTRAPGERTVSADVTRKADGATASRERRWARTGDGVTRSGERTGFDGRSRSADYARTRTGDGFVETGSLTRANGAQWSLAGEGGRTEDGRMRTRVISDGDGQLLRTRTDSVRRTDGMVIRDRQVVRHRRTGR